MKFRYLLVVLGLFSFILWTNPVQAGGDVSVCDEEHLLAALSGGGEVTFSCSGTITVSSTISINQDTTIDATGQNVTISGGGSVHVLGIGDAAVTLRNLTIANGYGGPYTVGAGINNGGNLTLDGVTVANNGSGSGGGIANSGPLTITNSTIRNNVSYSNGTGVGGYGAGIYNGLYGGDIFISNSTFYSNNANTGGAIYDLSGTVTIVNSTFYENGGTPNAGGAIKVGEYGTVNITNSTFSKNKAGQYSDGSAINNESGGSVTLENSVIAYSQQGDNCSGTITDGGGNLTYPDDSCPGINLDPVLGPLQDNGGPTLTTALLDGSSAIDNAIDSICNAAPVNGLDQRGVARPIGNHCDIGAYESDAVTPDPDFVMNLDMSYAAMCLSETAVFDVNVLSVAGFDSSVNLSVINLPGGTDAAFDNNPVIPTAASEVTISDTGTASVGAYTIDIVGTSVTRTQSVSASLYLYDTVPDVQPTLLTPTDGSTDTWLRPTFSWEPIDGVFDYQLEVATDSQFNNIVYSKDALGTSDTPYEYFEENTQYFWRVQTSNNCGEGPYSEVYSFTTSGSPPDPTFTLEVDYPTNVWICPSATPSFDILSTAINGFADPVTLSANDLPANATATFTNNPAVPPDLSELTISNLDQAAPGEHTVEIVGASATVTQSAYIFLNVYPDTPDIAPTLLTPTDGMTDTVLMPTLSWEAVDGSLYYMLKVATDSSFNNVVYSATTGQISHMLPPLDEGTQYFWQVTPANRCGVGAASAVFSFTTTGDQQPPTNEYWLYTPMIMMEHK
ncbi:MAG: choice-of-anchor Q domain-containing protein [Candidatus Promineifilaceae bacterium]